MVCDKVVDLRMEICENLRRGRYESGLVAVAASEVLRGDNRNCIAPFRLYQQNLAVVVSKIGALNNLGDERPEFERLVGSLVVENEVDARHALVFGNKEQAAQKLLGNGERSLPDFCDANLSKNPFENVGHLDGITQIRLIRGCSKRTQDFVNVGGAFHYFLALLPLAERLREGAFDFVEGASGAGATYRSYASQLAWSFLSRAINSFKKGYRSESGQVEFSSDSERRRRCSSRIR